MHARRTSLGRQKDIGLNSFSPFPCYIRANYELVPDMYLLNKLQPPSTKTEMLEHKILQRSQEIVQPLPPKNKVRTQEWKHETAATRQNMN
jgi:hypothetical protein